MAWERRGKHMYYYRKQRVGNRVLSRYVGRGPLAELCSAIDDVVRAGKHQPCLAELACDDTDVEDVVSAFIEDLGDRLTAAYQSVQSEMEGKGFHNHRGCWRKRRSGPARSQEHLPPPNASSKSRH